MSTEQPTHLGQRVCDVADHLDAVERLQRWALEGPNADKGLEFVRLDDVRAMLAGPRSGEAKPVDVEQLAHEYYSGDNPVSELSRQGFVQGWIAAAQAGEVEQPPAAAPSGLTMSEGFTPTTGQVRNRYAAGRRVLDARDACLTSAGELDAEFDRWLLAQRAGEAVDREALTLDELDRIAAEVGVTPGHVRAVLAARGDTAPSVGGQYGGEAVDPDEVTDADRLAARTVELLSTMSARNLRAGTSANVSLWRKSVKALADEVDRQYPGWIAAVQADRSAR